MIEFLSERVRTLFNELPIDEQRKWQEFARSRAESGEFVMIESIEHWGDELQVSVRIDQRTRDSNRDPLAGSA